MRRQREPLCVRLRLSCPRDECGGGEDWRRSDSPVVLSALCTGIASERPPPTTKRRRSHWTHRHGCWHRSMRRCNRWECSVICHVSSQSSREPFDGRRRGTLRAVTPVQRAVLRLVRCCRMCRPVCGRGPSATCQSDSFPERCESGRLVTAQVDCPSRLSAVHGVCRDLQAVERTGLRSVP
jgi:hypothetical protein